MKTLAVLLLMLGGLLIWAGITNNSITSLMGNLLTSPSKKKKNG